MPPIRHIKNTSTTVFFATLLLCAGAKASDISAKPPTEMFGLKIETHCKDLGQPYLDLKRFLEIGSGRKDIPNPDWKSQCVAGNPDFEDGYQSEFYLRKNNDRSETIELYFTPDMKLWKIKLNTTWDASDGPSLKITKDSLLQRFGSPILISEFLSVKDDTSDDGYSGHYAAKWSTRTALKKQVNASINIKSCTGISIGPERMGCLSLMSTRSKSLWDATASQLDGIVTDVSIGIVGRAEKTKSLRISMEDSSVSEKYYSMLNRENKKTQEYFNKYNKELDKKKVPNF